MEPSDVLEQECSIALKKTSDFFNSKCELKHNNDVHRKNKRRKIK